MLAAIRAGRTLTLGQGELGAERDEGAGEGAAHPGQHPRAAR